MRKKIRFLALLIASAGIFVYALIHLIDICQEYKHGADAYKQLENTYVDENKYSGEHRSEKEDRQDEESKRTYLQIDFGGLYSMNPDIIGWIQIPGADISYPLLKGADNIYYLTHRADKEYGINGGIFMDCHNSADFTDDNTIIYGHNMKDGSMFASLERYQDKSLYREEPYFYIYLPEKILEYQIVSCYDGTVESPVYCYHFSEKADFQNFLKQIQSCASYDVGWQRTDTDKVVTLSTCVNTSENGRYLIHGVLKREVAVP